MDDKNDKLDLIYMYQYKLQQKFGVIDKINSSDKLKQEYINQMILAIQEEAIEILRETAYKNPEYVTFGWKKNQKFNKELFKNEIIDILHFIFNLCIVADLNPDEIYNRYLNKNKINIKRQLNNY